MTNSKKNSIKEKQRNLFDFLQEYNYLETGDLEKQKLETENLALELLETKKKSKVSSSLTESDVFKSYRELIPEGTLWSDIENI